MADRRHVGVLGLSLALLVVGCGSDGTDDTSRGSVASVGNGTSTTVPAATTTPGGAQRAAARWETVATFSGTGPAETPEVAILPDAIQWRVRYSCESPMLRIESIPPPRRPGPLVDTACPREGEAFSIRAVPTRLRIGASGPWRAIVDQQVETPLAEPLPPGAVSASVAAQGSFYPLEKSGKGTARLYQLPDGRRILRLDDFEVSQNTDLFVWLSEAAEPTTTAEVVSAPKADIGNLKSTVGNQNYEVPADLPTDRIRSVVIWCEPVRVAYSAASLIPP